MVCKKPVSDGGRLGRFGLSRTARGVACWRLRLALPIVFSADLGPAVATMAAQAVGQQRAVAGGKVGYDLFMPRDSFVQLAGLLV